MESSLHLKLINKFISIIKLSFMHNLLVSSTFPFFFLSSVMQIKHKELIFHFTFFMVLKRSLTRSYCTNFNYDFTS